MAPTNISWEGDFSLRVGYELVMFSETVPMLVVIPGVGG